jgi:hypothetical protein
LIELKKVSSGGPLGNLFLSEHFYNLFLSVDDYL